MKRPAWIAALLLVAAVDAAGQALTCAGSPPAGCDRLHFHVRLWLPGGNNTAEVSGINAFSSREACEEARRQQEEANADALKFLATAAPRMKTQPNRYGPCHCDMTVEPTNASYLDDAKRVAQVRLEQQTRNELLNELVEKGLATDGELAMALTNPLSSLHPGALARQRKIPPAAASSLLVHGQLKETSVSSAGKDGNWQSELKLMEVRIPRTLQGAPQPVAATAQNPFITAETARIRDLVLAAAQSDATDKSAVLQAAAERMQLLSKLSRLIEVSGPQSALARAAAAAAEHAGARRSFVAPLFGSAAADHWEPANPAEMSFPIPAAIASDPVAVLRDGTGRFSAEQRKLALYAFLLQNPLAEADEPWLSSVAESNVKEDQ